MPSRGVKILDFDSSVTRQKKLLSIYKPEVIDLTDIAPRVRFWLNKNDREEIARRIAGSDRSAVTFLGSGDFHQVTEILISMWAEPMVLVDFDFHPDRLAIAPRYCCGSWARTAMRTGSVVRCVQVGTSKGAIKDMGDLANAVKVIPPGKAYVTIDKDCLTREYALTNWHEGKMSLGELLAMLEFLKKNFQIAGIDITGEYSPVIIAGMAKRVVAYLDRPKDFSAHGIPAARIDSVNEETNLRLLEILTQIIS